MTHDRRDRYSLARFRTALASTEIGEAPEIRTGFESVAATAAPVVDAPVLAEPDGCADRRRSDPGALYGALQRRSGLPAPANHPSTLASLSAVGELQLTLGQLAEAESPLREAVRQRAALLVPTHPALIESSIALAATLRRRGQPEAARARLRTLEREARRSLTGAHLGLLGRLLEELGQSELQMAATATERQAARAHLDAAQRLRTTHPDPWDDRLSRARTPP